MFEGAMTMGSVEAAHIFWRTPAEVFEIKLRALIAERLKPSTAFRQSELEAAAMAATAELNLGGAAGRKRVLSKAPTRTARPEWLRPENRSAY